MEQLEIYDTYELAFVTPTRHSYIYDYLVGRVWHHSLQRCGWKPRRPNATASCLTPWRWETHQLIWPRHQATPP